MIEGNETRLMAECTIGYLLSKYRTIFVRRHVAQNLLELGVCKHKLFDKNIEESEKGTEHTVCIYLPELNLIIAALTGGLIKDDDEDTFSDSRDSRAIAFASAPTKEARLLLLSVISSRDD